MGTEETKSISSPPLEEHLIKYPNHEYYHGETINHNIRHGYGKYYYKNGDKYEGRWYNNMRHGKGAFFYNEGEMYEGNFSLNKKDGMGVYYWKNGDHYHGQWKDNRRHGKGIMIQSTGEKYIGEFKNDVKNGPGQLIQKNGEVLYEEWDNGKLIRQSTKNDIQESNYNINFNECKTNQFEKFLNKKMIKQYETKRYQMKSKYFPLEMAKMMKNKNMDKMDSIRMMQSATSVVMENPDVLHWKNEDVVHWFKKLGCDKYVEKIEKSGLDGKKLLNCDAKIIEKEFGVSERGEINKIMKNLELLRGLKVEQPKVVQINTNIKADNEIEENENSDEEDDNNSITKHFGVLSLKSMKSKTESHYVPNNNEEDGNALKIETELDKAPKVSVLQEFTKELEYFYSSINVNGLNYFVNFEEITNIEYKVGQGGFSEVFLGKWQGNRVAIKKLTHKKICDSDILQKFINEINIISSLRHPNIVLYMGAAVDKDNYYMILEYLPQGSLFDLIHKEKRYLEEGQKIKIANDIAIAIKYLHNKNIVHCDLKSSNILLDGNLNIKLGDFGLSRFLTNSSKEKNHGRIGTPHWMAPEILKGGKYEPSADVFSYGMILWELLTYRIPYHNIDPNQIVNLITKEKKIVQVPDEGNLLLRTISEACIQYDPKARPTMDKILGLFQKVDREEIRMRSIMNEVYEFLT